MSDYNAQIIEEFRENHGRVGGHWEGRDLLLLTTRGRRSGREYTTPVTYTRDGDRLLVYASQGGSPDHPDWYLNLVADPHVTVEVGSERFDATAETVVGEERERLVLTIPYFAAQQVKTQREIPIVVVERLA